jgi:hypothetical protein
MLLVCVCVCVDQLECVCVLLLLIFQSIGYKFNGLPRKETHELFFIKFLLFQNPVTICNIFAQSNINDQSSTVQAAYIQIVHKNSTLFFFKRTFGPNESWQAIPADAK